MDPDNDQDWKCKKKINNQTIFTSDRSSQIPIVLPKTFKNFIMKTNKNIKPEFE